MKVLEVLDAELVLVDLEVNLGKNKQNSTTHDSYTHLTMQTTSPCK